MILDKRLDEHRTTILVEAKKVKGEYDFIKTEPIMSMLQSRMADFQLE
jgi:hypothetical protein